MKDLTGDCMKKKANQKFIRMIRSAAVLSGAFLGGILLFAASPSVAHAAMHEHGYTYRYDYWEDVQDSPDVFSVTASYTSADLALEVKMKNPQGLYANGDFLYICDTGNNRIGFPCRGSSIPSLAIPI